MTKKTLIELYIETERELKKRIYLDYCINNNIPCDVNIIAIIDNDAAQLNTIPAQSPQFLNKKNVLYEIGRKNTEDKI